MKNIFLLVALLNVILSFGQKEKELEIFKNSKNWKREIIKFPIDWAPKLKLVGFEELLFSPEWKNSESNNFWSLLIGWKVYATSPLPLKTIKYNLSAYFDGLMKPNHWSKTFPEPLVFLRQHKKNFYGTMTFFDGFHTGKILKVNILGEQKFIKEQQKTIIIFRLSLKNYQHKIWESLSHFKLKNKIYGLIDLDTTWKKEIFEFPISFATDIPYYGFEEARFPPKGWLQKEHPFFWSYTFAWKINLSKKITKEELEKNLNRYFDGLNRNKDFKTKAILAKTKENDSLISFKGKVTIYDRFVTKKPLQLNVLIDSKLCKNKEQSIVLFKFSPKHFTHSTWKVLKAIEVNKTAYKQ